MTPLLSLLLAIAAVGPQSRPVRFTAADGLQLAATYYPVATNPAPAVILVHGFMKNRQEWSPFALLLQKNHIAALALDLRGHGDSTRRTTADGVESLDAQQLGGRDFTNMTLDVEAAFDWLTDQPGIDPRRIAIAGSSVGANVALRYAQFNPDVAALLLLSPGVLYKGLRTDDVMTRIKPLPLRIVVSVGDAYAYESAKRLIEVRHETYPDTKPDEELIECAGPLHGTHMFTGISKLAPLLVNWLQEVLRARAPAPAPGP